MKRKPYDITASIIAYEEGRLSQDAIVRLFQKLVDSGLAWQLQGSYGRMAAALIAAGKVKHQGRGA